MKIVELAPKQNCNDIAKALRNIADDLDAGAYGFDPNMAVVVLGYETERFTKEGPVMRYNWQTHGLGKVGVFGARGLLAAAMGSFEGHGG